MPDTSYIDTQRIVELEAKVAAADAALEEFKKKVATRALEMAEQHELCSVVEDVLEELGVQIPERENEYVVYLRVRVMANTGERNHHVHDVHRALTRTGLSAQLGDFEPHAEDRVRALRLKEDSPVEIYDVRRHDNRYH